MTKIIKKYDLFITLDRSDTFELHCFKNKN